MPGLQEIITQFIDGIRNTGLLEYIAVFSGIASVWFSRKASVLTYPVGLIGTIAYVYLSLVGHLPGEATVNGYYTIMSFYGWYLWLRRDRQQEELIHVTWSDRAMLRYQFLFFLVCYAVIWICLVLLKKYFIAGAIPWADAFASSTAFTGMWLMTRKKVESWYWWIATNTASIPLYFVKGFVFTSVYYLVLLIFAFWGLQTWKEKASGKQRLSPI